MPAIVVSGLNYGFGTGLVLQDLSLELEKGSRCLLIGANGAGKSTLLRILAGKTLVKGQVLVSGKNAFKDDTIGVTYLGSEWAHNPVVKGDVPVSRLLLSLGAKRHPERLSELLDILDVDPNWSMNAISDGQRRRVQIVLGLLEPWEVLLLDEVTVDLDVLVRQDLLKFLEKETIQRGATIVYATHIFDGISDWATHIAHIAQKKLELTVVNSKFWEESCIPSSDSRLLKIVEAWLRKDKEVEKLQNSLSEPHQKTRWEVLSENMAQVCRLIANKSMEISITTTGDSL